MAATVGAIALCLVCAREAWASPLKVAALPASGSGVNSALLDVVDDTIAEKIEALGHEVVEAQEADLVLETGISKQGESVQVTLKSVQQATGTTNKAIATTTTHGLLARVSKMVAQVVVAQVVVAPPVVPETAVRGQPETPEVIHQDSDGNSSQIQGNGKSLMLVDEGTKAAMRASTGMLVSGTILTLAGIGLTIFTVHEWKDFDRWQKWAQETQCVDCVAKAGGKLKKNAVLTGVSAAILVPGPFILIGGIFKRVTALEMSERAAAMMPEVALSAGPGRGSLDLAWTF